MKYIKQLKKRFIIHLITDNLYKKIEAFQIVFLAFLNTVFEDFEFPILFEYCYIIQTILLYFS